MDSDKCDNIKSFTDDQYENNILKYLNERKKYVSKLILNKDIIK